MFWLFKDASRCFPSCFFGDLRLACCRSGNVFLCLCSCLFFGEGGGDRFLILVLSCIVLGSRKRRSV